MQIILVVEDLQLGGVERTCAFLANQWVKDGGHDVSIITFEDSNAVSIFELDSRIKYLKIGDPRRGQSLGFKILGFFNAVFRLREILRDEIRGSKAVVIGFLPHMCTYARGASLGLPVKMISSIRIFPGFEFTRSNFILNAAANLAYRMSDRIVIQTEAGKSYLSASFRRKVSLIPNSLLDFKSSLDSLRVSNEKRPFILSVGRLVQQKRFDILIEAFSRIAALFPSWNLVIAGSGELMPMLQQLVDEKRLQGRVFLIGTVSQLKELFENSEFLAMASDFEGFPNVLTEAMACGKPAVFTDCLSGPREIIQDGIDGFLVPTADPLALSEALKKMISDDVLRKKMGRAAKENVQRFSWEKINQKWQSLFNSLF